MRVLKHAAAAAPCAVSVAISSLMLFLCSAWSLSSASLALAAMSALGSGLIALMEFRSSSRVRCHAQREYPLSHSVRTNLSQSEAP
jgi:hypothetical protein